MKPLSPTSSSALRRFFVRVAVLPAIAAAATAAPLAQWQFDELATGDVQKTAWDLTTANNDLELRQGGTGVDLHNTTGTGVSGLAGDRFMVANLSGNASGRLANPQSNPAWQNLSGITFCGWVKVTTVPASGSQRLLHWSGSESVEVWFPWSAGAISLRLTDTSVHDFNGPAVLTAADVGKWVFLAVTYSGGQSANGVKFYRGTPTTPVTLIGQLGDTTATGNIQNTGAGDLILGNNASLTRNFPGSIDDFRIYAGEQTLNTLEGIRQSGLNPKELLFNPGFEIRTGTNWTADGWWHVSSGATYSYVYDTSIFHSGAASQQIVVSSLPAGAFHVFKQDVQLRGGRVYEGSVWVRSTTTNPARIRFYLRKAGQWYESFAVRTVTLTDTWQKLTIRGGSYNDESVYFGFDMLTPGTVWMDDASLTELTQATNVRELVNSGVVPTSFFGIHLNKLGQHNTWPAMGQKTIRLWDSGTRWGDLQPDMSDGSNPTHAWNFSRLDYYLKHTYTHTTNPTVLYTLGIPPKWAVPAGSPITHVGNAAPQGYDVSIAPPTNLSDWTTYVDQVARRIPYGDPANAYMKIKYWEVWNEVDVSGGNSNNDPRSYSGSVSQMRDLASAARTTLRNVDATNMILSPNITTTGLIWLESYLDAGGGAFADIYSVHAYGGSVEAERNRPFFAAVKDILSRYSGQSSKPIWNTEGAERLVAPASDSEAAGIVARKYIAQWVAGISNFDWYAWDIFYQYGVNLGTDPLGATLSPQGIGYRETVNWIGGANIIARTITPSPTGGERWVVEITKPSSSTYKGWIVWDSGADVAWTVPTTWGATQLRRLDATSSAVSGGASITIGPSPVLLEKP